MFSKVTCRTHSWKAALDHSIWSRSCWSSVVYGSFLIKTLSSVHHLSMLQGKSSVVACSVLFKTIWFVEVKNTFDFLEPQNRLNWIKKIKDCWSSQMCPITTTHWSVVPLSLFNLYVCFFINVKTRLLLCISLLFWHPLLDKNGTTSWLNINGWNICALIHQNEMLKM